MRLAVRTKRSKAGVTGKGRGGHHRTDCSKAGQTAKADPESR